MSSKPKIFTMVKCRAYLKKVNDTVRIQLYNADGTFCDAGYVTEYDAKAIAYKFDPEKNEEVEIANLSGFCGETVEKKYRERTEEEFEGVIVGYTRIKATGRIGTDWSDNPYEQEHGYCFKWIEEYPKVAVVYFKNNCKRYVPIDDLEEGTCEAYL